ncbi:hypothetical protein AVEN_25613-1 [Araneus ventricosus]|uniref:Uncharacterized protein n=1 Tax=Araneus ventricosus TaxID=182803 RepID=A0A4Y2BMY9_ARAVE|nr:hypothetical protein AVEN_25613-1 [Araneus ventricosus]
MTRDRNFSGVFFSYEHAGVNQAGRNPASPTLAPPRDATLHPPKESRDAGKTSPRQRHVSRNASSPSPSSPDLKKRKKRKTQNIRPISSSDRLTNQATTSPGQPRRVPVEGGSKSRIERLR